MFLTFRFIKLSLSTSVKMIFVKKIRSVTTLITELFASSWTLKYVSIWMTTSSASTIASTTASIASTNSSDNVFQKERVRLSLLRLQRRRSCASLRTQCENNRSQVLSLPTSFDIWRSDEACAHVYIGWNTAYWQFSPIKLIELGAR